MWINERIRMHVCVCVCVTGCRYKICDARENVYVARVKNKKKWKKTLNATRAVAVASYMHVAPSAHPTQQLQQQQQQQLCTSYAQRKLMLTLLSLHALPLSSFPVPVCLPASASNAALN